MLGVTQTANRQSLFLTPTVDLHRVRFEEEEDFVIVFEGVGANLVLSFGRSLEIEVGFR